MKRVLLSAILLGLFVTGTTLSTKAVSSERGYISVNTSANTEIAPDVAEISFAVKTTDTKSMQKATLENKEISDKVFQVLKGIINTTNGDYIKTSDFNAAPVYTYSSNKKVFEKYEVSNRIIVHTKSIDKLGEMIDKSISAGATNVDSLNFSASNYESQCNDLIGIATKKAQTRAGVIVKNLSTNLDGIRTFDTSCSSQNYNAPRMYMAKNMMSAGGMIEATADAIAPTSISEGVIKIYANVNATFFVKG